MILTKKQTKFLQGIAILFMLGLHLFNRIDIAGFYDVKIYWGGDTAINIHFIYI